MSFFGSLLGTDDAAKAIKKSQQKNISEANAAYSDISGMYQPYTTQGTAAFNRLSDLAGVNGRGAQTTAFGDFQYSPEFQVRYKQGLDALDRSSLAKYGSLNNGNVLKAVTNYGQDQGQLGYGDYYNRLAAIANTGYGATGAVAGARGNESQQIQGANTAIGQGEANAALAQGSLLMSGLGTLAGLAGYGLGPGFLRPTAASNLTPQQTAQSYLPPMITPTGYGFFRQ